MAIPLSILISTLVGYMGAHQFRTNPATEGEQEVIAVAQDTTDTSPSIISSLEKSSAEQQSPLEISKRLLEKLESVDTHETEQLFALLKTPRYSMDPGMQLVTRIVDHYVHLNHPEIELRRQIPEGHWKQLLQQWAARDVEAAFHFASTSEPEHLRADFLNAVFHGANGHAPQKVHTKAKVFELLESIEDDELRHYLALHSIDISETPEQFAAIAASYPTRWRDIYSQAFRAMGSSDPAEAIKALDDVAPARQAAAIEALLDGWSEKGDPADAAKWALENGSRLGQRAVTSWAMAQPVNALDHAFDNYTGEARIQKMGDMMHTALGSEPEEVIRWIDSRLNKTERGRILTQYAISNTRADPTEWQIDAATQAASVPSGQMGYLQQFVRSWQDKERRHSWVFSLPPVAQRDLVPEVLADWFLTNPQDAGAYVEALPNPTAKATVLNEMFEYSVYNQIKGNAAAETWARANLDPITKALVSKLNEQQNGGQQ